MKTTTPATAERFQLFPLYAHRSGPSGQSGRPLTPTAGGNGLRPAGRRA
ncbi:hypothetical protein AB0H43_38020 [Hamadaea sp. NPDC050747]